MLRRQLLEEAGVEVAGVVDEDVDAAEPLERRLHRRLRGCQVRDVELDDEQVVGLADGVGNGFGVAAGGDDCVAGGECGLCDVDAHPAACAGDEPHLLVSHLLQSFLRLALVAGRGTTEAGAGSD